MQNNMKKLLPIVIALAAAYFGGGELLTRSPENPARTGSTAAAPTSDDALLSAYRTRRSDVQVTGEGIVKKLLPDDRDGSRHQRFIIETDSGQTVLIAHNIDLAPRIDALRAGDRVEYAGEYEWNAKGGVIHWTHHDPQGRHTPGWLRHRGKTYE